MNFIKIDDQLVLYRSKMDILQTGIINKFIIGHR